MGHLYSKNNKFIRAPRGHLLTSLARYQTVSDAGDSLGNHPSIRINYNAGLKHTLNTVNLQRVPGLKKHYELLRLLEKEGFLIIKGQNKDISCEIIPYQGRAWNIIPVSKPSRKVNLNYHHITQLYKFGLGVSIFYTSKGYLTDKECIKHRIGGEYIYKIF